MAKRTATKKAPTKSEVFGTIAENTELTKRDVSNVFEELSIVIKKNLGSRGPELLHCPACARWW